ncbi:DNA-directed RNA polymerase III complex subunit Rpc37 [Schizosaccharomyces osmophilus]|uniref:DNA-directed RNA polymerase III complex subunit Rpc37 n=1 Tax=Schizosaccharomyces osmophilus TaxID=2545709 RepID=A0AAE9WFR3_9SCHI|nr:DNA-directed RNA polymerase III complex subunit Rpc37 [Schizosaccharomyces osmophilus]WBW75547.1 DNA-directed RNA polymerase III complex subunit Rpc37 [Schizosaccharomyces osmophilus]
MSQQDVHMNERIESPESQDDPVVRTLPVYYSPALRNHLLLNQYPLRPKNREYSSRTGETPMNARIKPKTGWMEMEVPIPTANYFDEDKAKKYSAENQPLRTQVLAGRLQQPQTNLMVGLIRNGQIHIVPLRGLTQLRPSMRHVDDHTQRVKASTTSTTSQPNASSSRGPVRAIQVTAKQNTEAPKLSTTHIIRATEEEEWQSVEIRENEEAHTVAKQLECPLEHQPNECTPADVEYSFL